MDITLHLINNSTDINNSQVVIFQKNVAIIDADTAIAWRVFPTTPGLSTTFNVPHMAGVSTSDSDGNSSPVIDPASGHTWSAQPGTSGTELQPLGACHYSQIAVQNDLPQGAINANIYKDGKLLATKTGVAPQQQASFEFKPTIWVGAVQNVQEGDLMNSAVLSTINTELSLEGITEANLIMSGGGPTPVVFTLVPTETVPAQAAV